jgi:hypothetical protein
LPDLITGLVIINPATNFKDASWYADEVLATQRRCHEKQGLVLKTIYL